MASESDDDVGTRCGSGHRSGFGGIAAAVRLQQAGISTFTVFERSDDLEECGMRTHTRCGGRQLRPLVFLLIQNLRLVPNSSGPTGVEAVPERYGRQVRRSEHFRFAMASRESSGTRTLSRTGSTCRTDRQNSSNLSSVRWDFSTGSHSGVAGPGRSRNKFHSARWEHQHDLSGKRIA